MVDESKVKGGRRMPEPSLNLEEKEVRTEEEIKKALEKIPPVPVTMSLYTPQFSEWELRFRTSLTKIDAWLEAFDINDDEQIALLVVKELSDCWENIKKQMNMKKIF